MLPRGRLYHCARCALQVFICPKCDRGNRYCSDKCSALARRDSIRMSNQRYQLTLRGRKGHAERTRRWRIRRNLTYQGSLDLPAGGVMAADLDATPVPMPEPAPLPVQEPAPPPALVTYRCHFCGCLLSETLRTNLIRRRGPHQTPQGTALDFRFDRGDLDDHSKGT